MEPVPTNLLTELVSVPHTEWTPPTKEPTMNKKQLTLGVTAALILVGGLSACGNSGADSGTKAAACARAATLNSQINDLVNQHRQLALSMSGGGPFGEQAALERQMDPLRVELAVQNKVCKS
jgi:hypothetical protein